MDTEAAIDTEAISLKLEEAVLGVENLVEHSSVGLYTYGLFYIK